MKLSSAEVFPKTHSELKVSMKLLVMVLAKSNKDHHYSESVNQRTSVLNVATLNSLPSGLINKIKINMKKNILFVAGVLLSLGSFAQTT